MANKVQKFREEVEKLKSQLLRGACSSQIAMETRCKEEAYNEVLAVLDTMQEEPVSEDLEEVVKKLWNEINSGHEYSVIESYNVFYGLCLDIANWQKEQFEKERLKHCDELTKEEAQIESDFVVNHLKKHNRTPSYIDAIEYGKKIVLAELERIVKEKEETGKNYVFVFSEVKDLVEKMSQKG